jgi:hypothetical protein
MWADRLIFLPAGLAVKDKRFCAPQPRFGAGFVRRSKGWQNIAGFLGQPISVAQRWAKTGMPVTREGRFVTASPEALNEWLGRESGTGPIHVATPQTDLSAELKRGLTYVGREHSTGRKSEAK